MPDPMITTKSELMGAIEAAWEALSGLLNGLTPQQMTDLRDSEGWSTKDHLTHLARWEASVAVLFRGRPRHEGLGIEESLYRAGDFDKINAVIQRLAKDLALGIVMAELRKNHDDVMAALRKLSDADLNRRVSDFFPQAPQGDDRRVTDIVFDNTAHHFAEHLAWIEALVGNPA